MDALISAQAGTALLIQGSELVSIHAGAPEQTIPRRAEEIHLLFGEALDLQVLQDVSHEQVARRLLQEALATEALQLCMILLDSELPEEIRRGAAKELDATIADAKCRESLEGVLYAHPLPSTADLPGALAHSEGHAPRVQDLLHKLENLQPSILKVRSAWIALPDTLFASLADRQRSMTGLVRAGLFRELVIRYSGRSVEQLEMVFRDRVRRAVLFPPVFVDPAPLQGTRSTLPRRRVARVPVTFRHYAADPFGLAAVQEIQQGINVERNYAQLYKHFHPRLLRYFLRQGLPAMAAEDLCQEVLFHAFRRLGNFRGNLNFARWLFVIAHDFYADELRRSDAEKRAGREVPLIEENPSAENDAQEMVPALSLPNHTPYDEVRAREEAAKLRAALQELPPKMRHCVYLRVFQGLKYSEVAEVMNVSIGTVKAYLGQAKVHLRGVLSGDEETEDS